jgi:hypothetical protein
VHAVDADMLIFVQGMCYATEISALYSSPPVFTLSSSKLVLVAHIYAWSYWSLLAEEQYNLSSWVPYAVVSNIFLASLFLYQLEQKEYLIYILFDSIWVWGVMSAICMIVYARLVYAAGCTPPGSVFFFVFSVMLSASVYIMIRKKRFYETRGLLLCTVYLACMGIATFTTVLSILSGNGTLFDVNVQGQYCIPNPIYLNLFVIV